MTPSENNLHLIGDVLERGRFRRSQLAAQVQAGEITVSQAQRQFDEYARGWFFNLSMAGLEPTWCETDG